MSTKAHVVLEFGNTRVELYRHWGGDLEITGFDLLQKIIDAPSYKERGFFHDGGYVLRLMLSDMDGELPQYQVVNGLEGFDWSHGYHLKFIESNTKSESTEINMCGETITLTNTDEVSIVNSCDGQWVIYYAQLEGWETLDDWKAHSVECSTEQFAELVSEATDQAIKNGKISDYDVREMFLSQFKRNT